MPILTYTTKNEVPEDLKDFVKEITEEGENKGKFSINVVPRVKLEEFRDTNVTNSKRAEKAEDFNKKFMGVFGVTDLETIDFGKINEEMTGLKETTRKVADGKLKASEDIDKVVNDRTELLRVKTDEQLQGKERELALAKKERDEAVYAYKLTFVDREVAKVCNDADLGVEPTAFIDIIDKARRVFEVGTDNGLTPKRSGQTMWGEDGTTPMSMKEWVDNVLRKDAPHYFKKSNGGGATGGGENKTYGMTEAEIDKLSPQRKIELANAASFANTKRR
jgi:hypothetical protein